MSRPAPGMVRLDPSRGSSLTLILDGPPDRSGGVGGWVASDRALRRPAKWWQSQPDDAITLNCIIDIDAIGGPDMAGRLEVLYAMGRKGKHDEPPTIRLAGDLTPQERRLRWVLQDIQHGARLFRPGGAFRRLHVSLSLEGYAPLSTIAPVRIKRTRNQQGRRRRRTVSANRGDTLRAIALRELGNQARWRELRDWNRKLADTDPDAPLRANTKVTIK